MSKIAEKAKFIDMYASLPTLSFGKDGKVYSRFGLLLTFLTIFIIGGMAIWIGIKIFGRHTPSFIQYELPAKVYNPTVEFNLDDFKFGFSHALGDYEGNRLLRTYGRWFDPDYKEIGITQKKCPVNDIPGMALGLEMDCWTQSESSKGKTYLDLKGNWDFRVMYYTCVDVISYDCYSEADAKAKLKADGTTASFYYEDLLVDPLNYENPISTTQRYLDATIVLGVGTSLVVELNEVEFTSDNGWIFQDLKIETKLKPTITMKVTNSEMLDVQFLYGGNKIVYKRSYPKIQDFLAQISGFITIITPIFLILVSPYGNLQAIQHMTNEIYEIKLNKPNNNGGNSPQKPAAKKKRRSSKSKISPTLAKETEGDLLPQKTMLKSKTRGQSLSTNRTKTLISPHAALVIGGFGKLPTPKENTTTFQFDTFDKSPSKISPLDDHSNLISPQKPFAEQSKLFNQEKQKPEDGKLNENLETIEVKDIENSDIDDQNLDEEVSDCETDVPLRTSDPLEVPWQAWLKSFWRPNPEVQVLKKAQEHLMEAFDLVTFSKKVIEIDKMKACLFTHDQRVIFENLPSSVIVLNPDIDIKSPEAIKQYHWKDSFKGDEVAVRKAYARLQGTKNQLDQLLLRLYESEYIDDGASL